MPSSQHAAGNAASTPALPQSFVSIRDVLEGKVRVGSRASVIGIIADFRSPIPTRKEDWKCQMRFYDLSVQDEDDSSLPINIFRPKGEMPSASRGDVVVITAAKVQNFQSDGVSLLTTWGTNIRIYKAPDIPKPPGNASKALRPLGRTKDGQPSHKETAYVSHMFHAIVKDRLPTESEFELLKVQSTNVKDKFSLLQNVCEGRFCDAVVQIVKEPYDMGDKITLWVSDYTENPAFFHYAFGGTNLTGGRDGDPFGYTTKFSNPLSTPDWAGPYGKKSMQITCFEPHATAIRESQMSFGTWVSIRNLQIKYGHNASNLEGYLREDRGATGPKLGICSLDPTDDKESINPHQKEALRRKRDYERDKKDQLKDIADASKAGEKRRAQIGGDQEPVKMNSKRRRNAQRARAREEPKSKSPVPLPDLSSQVKCENQDKPASLVTEILEPIAYDTTIDGKSASLTLPFVNTNYRANVRVVNFMPSKLEDFSFPKKSSEYDMLSDNEELSSESESENDMMTEFTKNRNWEWRFYLQLEDAATPEGQAKERFWAAVDNQAAQCLVNLDASNLHHDKKKLEELRQQLFLLWGDLEEKKRSQEEKKVKSIKAAREGRPPIDSSDEGSADEEAPRKNAVKQQFTNRPFPCCIRQYGVKVKESDATKADAGKGQRWQRMFGLFGTRISK